MAALTELVSTMLTVPQTRVCSLSYCTLSSSPFNKTTICMGQEQGSGNERPWVRLRSTSLFIYSVVLTPGSLREHATIDVQIPHTHAISSDGKILPAYYHLPSTASPSNKRPLIIIMTGLDGYRTELAVWIQGWHNVGCAVLIVEIPGTGDNPGDPSDPKSPDRVWSSMFDWIGQQEAIDQSSVVCWAFSTGGYYGIRLAHTHADKLKGVVALGGGVHHMFDPEWLDEVNHLEYSFE